MNLHLKILAPLKEPFRRLWYNKWGFGTVIAVLSALLAIVISTQFETLELRSYDARFAIRGKLKDVRDNIAVVTIDEETYEGLNTWPFPRAVYARAIKNLYEAGARLIVLDIVFAEPSNADPRNDIALTQSLKLAENVVLAGQITEYRNPNTPDIQRAIQPPFKGFIEGTGTTWGIANVDEDVDGFIRRYLLFYDTQNRRPYYPLAVRAYLNLRFGTDGVKNVHPYQRGYFFLGEKVIPKFDYNSMLINYRGPASTFQTFSLLSVLDDSTLNLGRIDTDIFELHRKTGTFQDKIVFIGASANDLNDNKLTPFYNASHQKMPGVEVHANALSTILMGDFIKTENPFILYLTVILFSGLVMILTKWLKPFRGLFAMLGLLLLYFLVTIYFFINHRVWIEFVAPGFGILLSYVGNVVHGTLTEQRERIRIKKSWEQYMAKDVIDAMLESGDLPKFGGERRELTVLFSDIRGFTTFSERHTSAEVVARLNEYLTEMVDVIFKHAGTLDKFVGDEIMAVYGAPKHFKEHAEFACLTAVEMVARLDALKRDWSARKQDLFDIGIGINSGKVISGNLGSSQLFDYTVIGDDVNLGARLEGANKQYGTTIIISESTYKLVRRRACARELDLVRVKGKNKPVKIFELKSMEPLSPPEQELLIDVYTQALAHYKEMRWYHALREFKHVLRSFPNDGPTRVYIKRCLDFIETPPSDNWDGVYEFTSK